VDLDEPKRLAETALAMGLKHVVITSVARDDLPDGGALQFARCLSVLREMGPSLTTEVLVPDFMGSEKNLSLVTEQSPNVFNHNLETVRRLTPRVRSKAQYDRSLKLLKRAKEQNPIMRTKSGIMLGLGEDDGEVLQALKDLREHGCEHLTLGQYLRPSAWHHPVHRYVSPEQFNEWGLIARTLGFSHVESAPLVRSSYHAEEGV
jgi:lipoic acid synthetase